MWQMAAYLGLNLARGYYADKGIGIENRFRRAMAHAQNTVRLSENELGAAVATANARRRSKQNQEILRSAGKAKDAAISTINRLGDMAARGKLSQRLAAAEELGRLTAAAGSAGVGGGSTAMLATTLQLRQERMLQQAQAEVGQQQDALEQQFDEIMVRAGMGLDSSIDLAKVTHVPFMAAQKQRAGKFDLLAQGIADTFFSGPGAKDNRQMFTDFAASFFEKGETPPAPAASGGGVPQFNFEMPDSTFRLNFGQL